MVEDLEWVKLAIDEDTELEWYYFNVYVKVAGVEKQYSIRMMSEHLELGQKFELPLIAGANPVPVYLPKKGGCK